MTVYAQFRNPGPEHQSNYWPAAKPGYWYPGPLPFFDKPDGGKRRIRYTDEMMHRHIALQVDREAARKSLKVNAGIWNQDGNEEYVSDPLNSYIPIDGPWPTPPIAQPLACILQIVKVLQVNGQWTRIETVDVNEPWPAIFPRTHPWLFVNPFKSLKVGTWETGNAIDDRGIVFPLYSDGPAWVPTASLQFDVELPEVKPMPLNLFPPINKGVAIWRLDQCFAPNPLTNGAVSPAHTERVLDFYEDLGAQSICLKIGNGLTKWLGLDPFISRARLRGFSVLGYWYYYGLLNEGSVSAEHTLNLRDVGLQGLELDVEKEFENSVGVWNGTQETVFFQRAKLVPKARAIMDALRAKLPTFPMALGSWRFPSSRPVPAAEFLKACDANSPQVYSLGWGGPWPSVAAQRINEAIAEYALPANGGWTGPTFPFTAAYHQDGAYVTVPQLAAVNTRVKQLNLPGLIWWFLPHIIEKTDWAAEIRSHDWPYTAPIPLPPDESEAIKTARREELDAIIAFAQSRKAQI